MDKYKNITLNFVKANYSKKYSFIPSQTAYKPVRQFIMLRRSMKEYKNSLIEKLPVNVKFIEISPMTKVMIIMFVGILAMG
jgi:hypothetical protein